jgi:hypothetical protein
MRDCAIVAVAKNTLQCECGHNMWWGRSEHFHPCACSIHLAPSQASEAHGTTGHTGVAMCLVRHIKTHHSKKWQSDTLQVLTPPRISPPTPHTYLTLTPLPHLTLTPLTLIPLTRIPHTSPPHTSHLVSSPPHLTPHPYRTQQERDGHMSR